MAVFGVVPVAAVVSVAATEKPLLCQVADSVEQDVGCWDLSYVFGGFVFVVGLPPGIHRGTTTSVFLCCQGLLLRCLFANSAVADATI